MERELKRQTKEGSIKYERFDKYLRFDLLGLARLEAFREMILEKTLKIKSVGKHSITGRVYHVGSEKVNGEQFYEIKMITKTGENTIVVCSDDRFRIKQPKKSKIDPYGEEDWEIFEPDAKGSD